MSSPIHQSRTVQYFVDEAGDATLFNGNGKIIVGSGGCSSFFILGKLDISDPLALQSHFDSLRAELMCDPYFKDVPSMQREERKTAIAFHAKDDVAEVRREVYKVLMRHEARFFAVVRDKRELLAYVKQRNETDLAYRYRENDLYDVLVSELFCKYRGTPDRVEVCFSRRGNRDRTEALRNALAVAEARFAEGFGFARKAELRVVASSPRESAGLQAADYYLWALQRFYERREDRYIEMLWPKVGEIQDLDLITDGRRGVSFQGNLPLNSLTRSP